LDFLIPTKDEFSGVLTLLENESFGQVMEQLQIYWPEAPTLCDPYYMGVINYLFISEKKIEL